MRSIYVLPFVLLACGDNGDKPVHPDAPPRPDAMPDAFIECHYTEIADATNDDLFGTGMAEATSLSFIGQTLRICGEINNGHFNATDENVDVDSYRITVPAETRGILYLDAAGASTLESTSVEISGLTTTVGVSEVGAMADTFAVTSAPLPPGDFLITVSSYNATDAGTAVPYKLTLELDSDQRCPHATGAVAYNESNDGATASGNDVYEVRYGSSPPRQLTLLGTDNPEPTSVTVEPGASYRITGISSNPASAPVSWMDDYQDRDTYEFTVGSATNTLAVRTNWGGTTTDLDFFVFQMTGTDEIATGWYNRNMEDEFTTLSVTPGATYRVMVAADDASTGFPTNYDLTLCGDTYTPDPAARADVIPGRHRHHPVFTRRVRPLSAK